MIAPFSFHNHHYILPTKQPILPNNFTNTEDGNPKANYLPPEASEYKCDFSKPLYKSCAKNKKTAAAVI